MDPSREPIDIDDPASGPQSAPATSHASPSEGSQPAADVEPREAGSPGALGDHARTEPSATPDNAEPASFDPADTLSPAVRRLVRQYDLDITGIHGTGPAGKIRVGDVIGMLGGRTDAAGARANDPTPGTATAGEPDTGRDAVATQDFRKSRAEDDAVGYAQQPARRTSAKPRACAPCRRRRYSTAT